MINRIDACLNISKYQISGRYFWLLITLLTWYGMVNAYQNSYPFLVYPSIISLVLLPIFCIKHCIKLQFKKDELHITQKLSLFKFQFKENEKSYTISKIDLNKGRVGLRRDCITSIFNSNENEIVTFKGLRKIDYDELDKFFS